MHSECIAQLTAWQNRPLEPCYPVVFMDAIRVNIRSDGAVSNKAVFVALAILPDGTRDVLGLWFQANEGAKFWAKVLNDLRNRGVQDILIAVVDGLKGFPQAIEAAFPQTQVQTCIVHLLRHSMSFASYKDRKAVAVALKAVYSAVDPAAAEAALTDFEESDLAARYPAIAPSWRRAWTEVIPFLDYPPEVRRLIYTTNAVEALNSKIRRAVRTRGHFPSDEAAAKLIYLALNATECYFSGVEALGARVARGEKPARHHVRGPLPNGVINAPGHRIPDSLAAGSSWNTAFPRTHQTHIPTHTLPGSPHGSSGRLKPCNNTPLSKINNRLVNPKEIACGKVFHQLICIQKIKRIFRDTKCFKDIRCLIPDLPACFHSTRRQISICAMGQWTRHSPPM